MTSLGIVLAFLAWIYVFKRGFETGWIRAAGIAIFAIIVFVTIGVFIAIVTHLFEPNVTTVLITFVNHCYEPIIRFTI